MKKRTLKVLAALLLSVFILSGCSFSFGKKFAENIPEGCPDNNSGVIIASEEVKSFDTLASHFIVWGSDASINFANYEGFNPENKYGHDLVGTDALVVLKLKHSDNTPVSVGKFETDYKKDVQPAKYVDEFNVSTENLAGGSFDEEGYVELTYLDDTLACGVIKSDDGRTKMEGPFISNVKIMQ